MYVQLWLCLAALCVIDEEHAEALSSGQWLGQDGKPKDKVCIYRLLYIPNKHTLIGPINLYYRGHVDSMVYTLHRKNFHRVLILTQC